MTVELQGRYGASPAEVGDFRDVELEEFMNWMYLPVRWNTGDPRDVRLPWNLLPIADMVQAVIDDLDGAPGQYVYVTGKHNFATPGNPLNRGGWHCDGFGTDDLNYVWWLGAGTRFLTTDYGIDERIPSNHLSSLEAFEKLAEEALSSQRMKIGTRPQGMLYKIDRHVIHATPEIPEPGQMRSWVKVSVSPNRYNLMGNAHNDKFEYRWRMWPRSTIRNDPSRAQSDFYHPDGAAT